MPVRALLNRFALLLLILSAFAIMLLGKAETVAVERVRSGVVDVVAPRVERRPQQLQPVHRPLRALLDALPKLAAWGNAIYKI